MVADKTRVVIALGGNAILKQGQTGTYEEQLENVKKISETIADIALSGDYQPIVTHGNGPQVGAILLQNKAGESEGIPAKPMDVCVAKSQGFIGYMLQQSLDNVFRERGREDISAATILTQTVVDKDDPAFENPSKPVGPFYEKKESEKLSEEKGWTVINDAGRGWRRVVPSPDPITIVEEEIIKGVLKSGAVPIVAGGGGIPVVKENKGHVGREAVIDKDLASERVGESVKADILLILTDVEGVAINYGKSDEKMLDKISIEEIEKYMEEGHFAEGSMKPKVKACIRFLEAGGGRAIIASLDDLSDALEGTKGTEIIKK